MNFFKKLKLSVLLHKHEYNKILSETAFNFSKKSKDTDPDILRYQGICSFYKNNLYHSKMCCVLLAESNRVQSNDFVYLAYLNARQNEKLEALNNWCKALEINKKNKYATKALDYVRSKGRSLNLMEDPAIVDFIPKEPRKINFAAINIAIAVAIVVVAVVIVGLNVAPQIYNKYKSNKLVNRPELDKVHLDDFNPNIIESPKQNDEQFSYNEKEIKDKFEKIKSLIAENRVVQAQIMINQIKLSNASPAVKMKMDILKDFITEPDYGFFKNELTFEEFVKNKPLYEDVYIMWQGRVINKSIYKDRITYDLVLGDQEAGVIDAIIPVVFNKAVTVNNNELVIVFGKIAIDHEQNKTFIDGHNVIRL